MPIVDEAFRGCESFISIGPLQWIDRESEFKPTIYAPLRRILQAIDEITERISRIKKLPGVKIANLAEHSKHLLFFLCDLISVIHPATVPMVEYYLGRIAPSILSSNINVPTLVGLGLAMNLLREHEVISKGVKQSFLSPYQPSTVERPFHHSRLLDLQGQRASHISVLLKLPEAKTVLDYLRKTS